MKNLKLIWLVLLIICCVGSVFAQKTGSSKPDFGGVWTLEYSQSRFDKFTSLIHKKLENFSRLFVITQKANTLKTVEKNTWTWIDKNSKLPNSVEATKNYFTDSRGEVNIVGGEKFRTKTKWVGNKLFITHITDGRFVKVEPYATSEISLSDDKNKLTWHYKIIADNKEEEEAYKDLQTYLVFIRRKE